MLTTLNNPPNPTLVKFQANRPAFKSAASLALTSRPADTVSIRFGADKATLAQTVMNLSGYPVSETETLQNVPVTPVAILKMMNDIIHSANPKLPLTEIEPKQGFLSRLFKGKKPKVKAIASGETLVNLFPQPLQAKAEQAIALLVEKKAVDPWYKGTPSSDPYYDLDSYSVSQEGKEVLNSLKPEADVKLLDKLIQIRREENRRAEVRKAEKARREYLAGLKDQNARSKIEVTEGFKWHSSENIRVKSISQVLLESTFFELDGIPFSGLKLLLAFGPRGRLSFEECATASIVEGLREGLQNLLEIGYIQETETSGVFTVTKEGSTSLQAAETDINYRAMLLNARNRELLKTISMPISNQESLEGIELLALVQAAMIQQTPLDRVLPAKLQPLFLKAYQSLLDHGFMRAADRNTYRTELPFDTYQSELPPVQLTGHGEQQLTDLDLIRGEELRKRFQPERQAELLREEGEADLRPVVLSYQDKNFNRMMLLELVREASDSNQPLTAQSLAQLFEDRSSSQERSQRERQSHLIKTLDLLQDKGYLSADFDTGALRITDKARDFLKPGKTKHLKALNDIQEELRRERQAVYLNKTYMIYQEPASPIGITGQYLLELIAEMEKNVDAKANRYVNPTDVLQKFDGLSFPSNPWEGLRAAIQEFTDQGLLESNGANVRLTADSKKFLTASNTNHIKELRSYAEQELNLKKSRARMFLEESFGYFDTFGEKRKKSHLELLDDMIDKRVLYDNQSVQVNSSHNAQEDLTLSKESQYARILFSKYSMTATADRAKIFRRFIEFGLLEDCSEKDHRGHTIKQKFRITPFAVMMRDSLMSKR